LGLTVVLEVTEDIRSDNGFSIQLNANSPAGNEVDAFQQYGFSITDGSIQGFIANFANALTEIVCDYTDVGSTPIDNGIPAGYSLVLRLLNDDAGNITGTNYQVFDSRGVMLANNTFLVQDAGCNCSGDAITCLGFKQGDLSPITAFTIDIVGPGNGSKATFSGGAGNIIYTATGRLTPLASTPTCVEQNLHTEETSNATYGTLNGCPRQFVTQPFSVTVGNTRPCCPAGSSCKCGGLCVPGVGCVGGQCLEPGESCN
jgi:hypothetical protein